MTTNFQPGDKIKAGPFTADLGLTPGNVYTVHHIDDFGLVQPDAVRHHHFHPSHFELVERAAPAETYCLLDGEGDWWFLDQAPNAVPYWRMLNDPLVYRVGLDAGAEEIGSSYGIDAEPSAPAETYCLKDKLDGDWHYATESAEGPFLLVGGDGETYRPYEEIAERWGIDAAPAACSECASYDPNTGLHWDTCPNRGSVYMGSSDPAPLAVGDWVKVLARVEQVYSNGSVKAQTYQTDGSENGPSVYAIASDITRTDEVPEWAVEQETYCLKDSDGMWWVSTDPETNSDMGYDPVLARWPARIGSTWKVAN